MHQNLFIYSFVDVHLGCSQVPSWIRPLYLSLHNLFVYINFHLSWPSTFTFIKKLSNMSPFSLLQPMNKDASCTTSKLIPSVVRHFLFVFAIPVNMTCYIFEGSVCIYLQMWYSVLFHEFIVHWDTVMDWMCHPKIHIHNPHMTVFGEGPLRK